MARKTILAAGALSLLLVGTRGTAQADDTDRDAQSGVLHLFGKTICLADTPAGVQCDWRLPEAAPAPGPVSPPGFALTWFGTRYCVGTPDAGACDRRLGTGKPEPEPQSRVLRLLGLDICFGDISPASRCDLKLPPLPEESGQRHARL